MTRSYSIGFALLITLIFAVAPTAGAEPTIAQHTTSQEIIYSVVISGGTVYDGLGKEGVRTDVGILGARIAAIGDLSVARAARRIDATMLAVVPGFIDIHSHATPGSPESSGVVQRPSGSVGLREGDRARHQAVGRAPRVDRCKGRFRAQRDICISNRIPGPWNRCTHAEYRQGLASHSGSSTRIHFPGRGRTQHISRITYWSDRRDER